MMQPYQQRVVDEKSELDEKCRKLSAFFASSQYPLLNEDEKERLCLQWKIMGDYSGVLGERIKAFTKEAAS